jgi:predicted dienelactone hydrolase
MPSSRRSLFTVALASLMPLPSLQAQPKPSAETTADETWLDPSRQREVPIKLRWPDAALHPGVRPVVLFSHGLGGTREGGAVWGQAWAAAGFVVVHLQHPGSDLAAVRAVASSFADQRGLRSVAAPTQLVARLKDVGFVLDEIERRHVARVDRWGSARPTQIGMSGHSFGAHTTLGMAGQRYPATAAAEPINDARIASFIAFSPTAPLTGDAKQAFAGVTRPLLSITGTRDSDVAGVGATPERRMAVFGALPAGDKAHLVLQDADHMTFGGQTGRAAEVVRREAVTRDLQTRHHALVAAVTTDWWRATLMGDASARERLIAPTGLAAGDVWQRR